MDFHDRSDGEPSAVHQMQLFRNFLTIFFPDSFRRKVKVRTERRREIKRGVVIRW